MVNALQITFRGMEPSDAVRAAIADRAQRLDRFHDHITGGHVVFEQLHRRHHQGNLYHVRIDVSVPGGQLVVGREHHEDHAHEDPYVAVRDAFDSLRRQLEDYVRTRGARAEVHEAPQHGRVLSVDRAGGFGHVEAADGRQVYFHRNAVVGAAFETIEPGDPVRFDLHEGEGRLGPQASTVRVIGKHHLPDVVVVPRPGEA